LNAIDSIAWKVCAFSLTLREISTRPFQLVTGRVTHVLKLEDINKGFDLMHEGKSIRSVVVF